MSLPKPISTAVASALNKLHRHPDRLLSLEPRRSIYTSFRQVDSSGQRARAQLDILTARYVLPYWQPLVEQRWKRYDYMPDKMITHAEGLLAGRVEKEAVMLPAI